MDNGTKGGPSVQHPAEADPSDLGYLRFPEVHRLTQLSRTTLWRMERDGAFPARRKLSRRAVGWLASEVRLWSQQRAKAAGVAEGDSDERR